jgi:hypothetical protein
MIGALLARKAIAGAFDALNRHDLSAFMSAWRDAWGFVFDGIGDDCPNEFSWLLSDANTANTEVMK